MELDKLGLLEGGGKNNSSSKKLPLTKQKRPDSPERRE